MGWMMVMVTVLATSVCSALLTGVVLYMLFLRKIGPMLDRKLAEAEKVATRKLEEARETANTLFDEKLEEAKAIASSVEGHVAAGVREGIKNSVTDLPTSAVKSTMSVKDSAMSVAKEGAGLLEGSLSALFGNKDS